MSGDRWPWKPRKSWNLDFGHVKISEIKLLYWNIGQFTFTSEKKAIFGLLSESWFPIRSNLLVNEYLSFLATYVLSWTGYCASKSSN